MEKVYQNNGIMFVGRRVFVSVADYDWRKQFGVTKEKIFNGSRRAILQGVVTGFTDRELKILLRDNNGFEKDNNEFVFNKSSLLAYESYSHFEDLGKWIEI